MSEIPLYNVLTKLGANPEEAREALSEVANSKDMATKMDLANLEIRIIKWVVGVGITLFFGLSGVIFAAIALLK